MESRVSIEMVYEKLLDLERRLSRIERLLLEVRLPEKYLRYLDKLYEDAKKGKNLVSLEEVEAVVLSKD